MGQDSLDGRGIKDMNKKSIITALLASVALAGQAQADHGDHGVGSTSMLQTK